MLSSEHEQQLYKDFRTDRLSLEVTEFFLRLFWESSMKKIIE